MNFVFNLNGGKIIQFYSEWKKKKQQQNASRERERERNGCAWASKKSTRACLVCLQIMSKIIAKGNDFFSFEKKKKKKLLIIISE